MQQQFIHHATKYSYKPVSIVCITWYGHGLIMVRPHRTSNFCCEHQLSMDLWGDCRMPIFDPTNQLYSGHIRLSETTWCGMS
uniref:Uncharacterized protein n=1 Tax=Triticum urartu TaxID=4572 RepID=A0A8R7U2L0_TRIUA